MGTTAFQAEESGPEIGQLSAACTKDNHSKFAITNWLANNTQNNTDLITKSVDSLAMLGNLNTQLAQLRRDQIQPTLRPKYKPICAIEVPAVSIW